MKRILATTRFIDVPSEIPEDFLVLTPNRAAASRLRVPHRSLRSLAVEILNREGIGVATPLRSLHVLRSVVGELIPDRDAAAEAARVRRILATVLRDGIDITAMTRSGIPSVTTLAVVAKAYCDQLWTDRLVDAESVLWKAAGFIRERRKLLVYGYFRAREHDIRFIDTVAGDGSIYVVPSGNESIFASANRSIDSLTAQGWLRNDRETDAQSDILKSAARFSTGKDDSLESGENVITAFVYPNVDAEVRGALAAAKKMVVEGANADRIAIVCRKSSDYEHTIMTVAKEYGVTVSSQSKISLAETTLGSYINLILAAKESDFEFAVTARLLNHKYGPGMSEEAWALARRRRSSGIDAWNEAGVDLGQLTFSDISTLNVWIDWLLKAVPFALVRERAAESASELIAYEVFHDAIEELKTLGDGHEIDLLSFSRTIGEFLENIETRIDPRNGGIAFHQPNTIIGGEFDHIFVLGMAEGTLPAITNEDAVIDFYEQRKLEEKGIKFDRPAEFPRWEALSFYYVLLAARNGITLSFPKTVDIEEKIASPYFERLSIRPIEAKTEWIASPQEELKVFLRRDDANFGDVRLSHARHQFEVERRRESSAPYDEYDGVTGIPIKPESRQWSASQLTKIGQCPFKWFSEKILRLSPTEEGDTDLRGSVMGRLYHKTLQIAVTRAFNSVPFRDDVLAGLENAFLEAESDEEIGVHVLPNWEHRRSEHLSTLRKAIESPEFIGEGSRVLATEQAFDVNWNGFKMRGSIDRVDDTPNGIIAIDYKTGTYVGKVKDATGELETDIQLPIYSNVALEAMFPGRVASGHYFSLRQTKIIPQKPADIDGFAANVRKILEAGNFAVDPDGKRKSCKFCEYDPVCRRGQRNARKPRS